jgi:hypothetical protein
MIRKMNVKKHEDQKYIELLQKLRVSQIGVQVLFAFLLAVPFSQRFEEVQYYQKIVLVGALLTAAVSAILHIAPVNHHWILAGEGLKIAIVDYANMISRVALLFMVGSMLACVFLFVDVILGMLTAIICTSVGVIFSIIFLYVVPLRLRRKFSEESV